MGVWCNNKLVKLPDTLLGFETTGPATPVPTWLGLSAFDPLGLVVFVVALLWWWGVVFDLWIVVASILHAELLGCWPSGWWS